MSNSTASTVKAYFKRTDYSPTLSTQGDRVLLKAYEAGLLRDGLSRLRYKTLQFDLSNREIIDGAAFDPDGALHPVQAGTTPLGVPSEIQTFTPEADDKSEKR